MTPVVWHHQRNSIAFDGNFKGATLISVIWSNTTCPDDANNKDTGCNLQRMLSGLDLWTL